MLPSFYQTNGLLLRQSGFYSSKDSHQELNKPLLCLSLPISCSLVDKPSEEWQSSTRHFVNRWRLAPKSSMRVQLYTQNVFVFFIYFYITFVLLAHKFNSKVTRDFFFQWICLLDLLRKRANCDVVSWKRRQVVFVGWKSRIRKK